MIGGERSLGIVPLKATQLVVFMLRSGPSPKYCEYRAVNAIGYIRETGPWSYSFEQQSDAVERYCAKSGLRLCAMFFDDMFSEHVGLLGASRHARAWSKMNGSVAIVVPACYSYCDEAFRAEALRRALERQGVVIFSVAEPHLTIPVSGEDPIQRRKRLVDLQRKYLDCELLHLETGERLRLGRETRAKMNLWQGHRPRYEHDVVEGELVINAERARIIRHIWRLAQMHTPEGDRIFSGRQICEYLNGGNNLLNKDGTRGRIFPAPAQRQNLKRRTRPYKYRRDGGWNTNSLNRILRQLAIGTRELPYARI